MMKAKIIVVSVLAAGVTGALPVTAGAATTALRFGKMIDGSRSR
jgi:hypothetical protein